MDTVQDSLSASFSSYLKAWLKSGADVRQPVGINLSPNPRPTKRGKKSVDLNKPCVA